MTVKTTTILPRSIGCYCKSFLLYLLVTVTVDIVVVDVVDFSFCQRSYEDHYLSTAAALSSTLSSTSTSTSTSTTTTTTTKRIKQRQQHHVKRTVTIVPTTRRGSGIVFVLAMTWSPRQRKQQPQQRRRVSGRGEAILLFQQQTRTTATGAIRPKSTDVSMRTLLNKYYKNYNANKNKYKYKYNDVIRSQNHWSSSTSSSVSSGSVSGRRRINRITKMKLQEEQAEQVEQEVQEVQAEQEVQEVQEVREVQEHEHKEEQKDHEYNNDDDKMNTDNEIIKSFIQQVNQSIHDRTFVSIVIRGISKKKSKNNSNSNNKKKQKQKHITRISIINNDNENNDDYDDDNDNDIDYVEQEQKQEKEQQQSLLRGRIRLVTGRLITLQTKQGGTCTKLHVTFKYHYATDIVKNWDVNTSSTSIGSSSMDLSYTNSSVSNNKQTTNDVVIGLEILFNIRPKELSMITTTNADNHQLVPVSEWDETITTTLSSSHIYHKNYLEGSYWKNGIQNAILETIDGSILQLDVLSPPTLGSRQKEDSSTARIRMQWKKNTKNKNNNDSRMNVPTMQNEGYKEDIGTTNHDRMKQFPVSLTEPFWRALGMMVGVSAKSSSSAAAAAAAVGSLVVETTAVGSGSGGGGGYITLKPAAGMSSKIKQCQKFVEIVDRLVQQCMISPSTTTTLLNTTKTMMSHNGNNDDSFNNRSKSQSRSTIPEETSIYDDNEDDDSHNDVGTTETDEIDMDATIQSKNVPKKSWPDTISVVDMGCGRGYVTFALHCFLQTKYDGTAVQSLGVDVRPKLVQEINTIAQSLDERFQNSLRFETGAIENFITDHKQQHVISTSVHRTTVPTTNDQKHNTLDVLIALHACDTATDDAIWCGISRQVDVIVVAPCCHKQIRPQLDTYVKKCGSYHPMADILRHNIYRERSSETVTDSLRAMLLELAGYTVQVFEFIGGEHTSKNVMITAVRRRRQSKRLQPQNIHNLHDSNLYISKSSSLSSSQEQIRNRIRSLAALHGIQNHKLAQWMNETLLVKKNHDTNNIDLTIATKTTTVTSLLTKKSSIGNNNSEEQQQQQHGRKMMLSNRQLQSIPPNSTTANTGNEDRTSTL